MKNLSTTSVFLIDKHQLTRETIKVALDGQPNITIIGEARDGYDALTQLNNLTPDVILLDLNLPDTNGKLLVDQLRHRLPASRIIVFTAQQDLLSPLRCLDAGAVGYVTKQQPASVLIEAILTASAKRPYISPDLAKQMAANQLHKPVLFKQIKQLSPKEIDMVPYFALGKKTDEIAKELHVSPHTVNCHRHRVLKKLKLENEVALAHLAIKLKLIDIPT